MIHPSVQSLEEEEEEAARDKDPFNLVKNRYML